VGEYPEPRILLNGETAISVELGDDIDPRINRKVQSLFRSLGGIAHPGVLSLNPTYSSLFIEYDPRECSFEQLLLLVRRCLAKPVETASEGSVVVDIPVCYGGDLGPDLEYIADYHDLKPEEVIRLHSAPIYSVYMIGFTPGFPYLGGLDERLYTPRREDPRSKVPAGSVAIADRQTGIYSIDSPGGWRLIGRTPVRLFDLGRPEPFHLKPGDSVRFRPITKDEFEGLANH
jgi:inhibitor of KinA